MKKHVINIEVSNALTLDETIREIQAALSLRTRTRTPVTGSVVVRRGKSEVVTKKKVKNA